MDFILGSQSPRRREILSFFHLTFKQISPEFDEEAIPFNGNPHQYVQLLSRGKGESLASRFPQSMILTADTIVYLEEKIYGKPQNEEEAYRYLKELSGKWHSVFTALTLFYKGEFLSGIEETKVHFNSLSEEQIRIYLQSLEFKDKAGGYMIQGAGSLIVNRIEGCYFNVVGLPVNLLYSLLLQVDIDLWKYLKRF